MLNYKDFLKKYSTVPNQFIEDFYKISDYKEINNNEMTIDLDDVVKWLKIIKKNGKDTLIKSYIKNVDYKIIKNNKTKGSGGHNKEMILLTINCFKKFCQLTKSIKGNEVREYFITVEGLLNKYKNYIIEGMEDKISKLEKSQKPKINPSKGVIYIFRTANTPDNSLYSLSKPLVLINDIDNETKSHYLYKIGRTKDLKKRLQSHQSPLSHDIDVLFYYEADDIVQIEKCIKIFMKEYQYRKYKEVYKINIDIIKSLIGNCDNIKISLDEKVRLSELKEDKNKNYYINISK